MVPDPDRSTAGALTTLIRRLLEGVLTAWAAVSFTFFALRIAGGDPLASLISRGLASQAQAAALRASLGLDRSLLSQYFAFMTGLAQGDLGVSLLSGRPVAAVIAEQLPATARLAVSGLAIALLVGSLLGIGAAWNDQRRLGTLLAAVASLMMSVPVAFTGVLALILVTALATQVHSLRMPDPGGLFLPALVLGLSSSGAIARVMQAGLAQSIASLYFTAAQARGIRRGPRLLWHALRPALPPAVALTALEAAFFFSGTVVTETVFSRPGLGRLLIAAILQGDFPVAQGLVVLAAMFYTASQIAADGFSVLIDPRLRRHV
jgi:peptide/nickel transport system permease protein